eukprot:Blabericola_migrator_1__9005@NODE_4798_length_977_cov_8_276923_g2991_i0_p1_GENE_NODE_4798_length_977_cov_8_276923_g2991_i0NODE_4798_length_977_cov_8_276923_g2991_i0_p1_ORF_typecomplete_len281_score42_39CHAD/PF05235_14/0_013Asparaginase_2/PF01112_18/0_077Tam41_Mmp37/PF09139_11/0_26_NODE_4798_length_977_cov_8_276923_g2991_i099941
MTCLRSVVSSEPFRLDAESRLWTVMIPCLISVASNISPDTSSDAPLNTQHGANFSRDLAVVRELYDSFTKEFGSEDVLPHFQAAIAAAAKEIEASSRETTVSERLETLVKQVRRVFSEAGLTPQVEKTLEAALSNESWLSTVSGWAWGGLKRGVQLASKTHHLLFFVSLLGTVGALPIDYRNDEVADAPITDDVAERLMDEFAPPYEHFLGPNGPTVIRVIGALDVVLVGYVVHLVKTTIFPPNVERYLERFLPSGLYRLVRPPAEQAPIPMRAKKARRG